MYLNGKYFHNDLEYQQKIDALSPFVANLIRSYFLNYLINTTKLILIYEQQY